MQPLLSQVPMVSTRGNHEVELLVLADNTTMTSVNARFPIPQVSPYVSDCLLASLCPYDMQGFHLSRSNAIS